MKVSQLALGVQPAMTAGTEQDLQHEQTQRCVSSASSRLALKGKNLSSKHQRIISGFTRDMTRIVSDLFTDATVRLIAGLNFLLSGADSGLLLMVRGEYPLEINPRRKTPQTVPPSPEMNPPG